MQSNSRWWYSTTFSQVQQYGDIQLHTSSSNSHVIIGHKQPGWPCTARMALCSQDCPVQPEWPYTAKMAPVQPRWPLYSQDGPVQPGWPCTARMALYRLTVHMVSNHSLLMIKSQDGPLQIDCAHGQYSQFPYEQQPGWPSTD